MGILQPSYVADAIRAAAPRFGIEAEVKIVPIPSADRHAR